MPKGKKGKQVALSGRQALEALDPTVRLAVELYTNPMYSETFGNFTRSAAVAGLGNMNPMRTPMARAAIAYLNGLRDAQAEKVAEVLGRYSIDAAHRLVRLLGADTPGDGELPMAPMDPRELLERTPEVILGERKDGTQYVVGYDDGHLKQAKGMIDHNKAVAALVREARETIKLILAYKLGPPGRSTAGKSGDEDPLDLGKLSTEELRDLARHVEEVRVSKEADAPVVRVVEEGHEKGADPPEGEPAPVSRRRQPRPGGMPF